MTNIPGSPGAFLIVNAIKFIYRMEQISHGYNVFSPVDTVYFYSPGAVNSP